jgi:hypothetical protein
VFTKKEQVCSLGENMKINLKSLTYSQQHALLELVTAFLHRVDKEDKPNKKELKKIHKALLKSVNEPYEYRISKWA